MAVDIGERSDLGTRIRKGTPNAVACRRSGVLVVFNTPLLVVHPRRQRLLFVGTEDPLTDEDREAAQVAMAHVARFTPDPRPPCLA